MGGNACFACACLECPFQARGQAAPSGVRDGWPLMSTVSVYAGRCTSIHLPCMLRVRVFLTWCCVCAESSFLLPGLSMAPQCAHPLLAGVPGAVWSECIHNFARTRVYTDLYTQASSVCLATPRLLTRGWRRILESPRSA